MASNRDFAVQVSKKEVVVPAVRLHDYWLPQSNLDSFFPPMEVSTMYCYKKPSSFTFGSVVTILKKSLAQVLVPYYVLSGEIGSNSLGEPELHCNNRGVDFLEAHADIELQHLDFYRNNENIREKLLPLNNQSVMCVQVTEMKCGGLVVACTFDHRIIDAYSSNMFIASWAEIAQSKPLSLVPSFRRSLLMPSYPHNKHVASHLDNTYVRFTTLQNLGKEAPDYRFYYIEEKQIKHLHSLANCNKNTNNDVGAEEKSSKLEAFCAFMAKTGALTEVDNKKTCKIGVFVDGRKKLITESNNYFGNVLAITFCEVKSGDLKERSLSWVADKVHNFIKVVSTKEYFQDLIDWVDAHRPGPFVPNTSQRDEGSSFFLSSGLRLGEACKLDFGWGKPLFATYHDPKGQPATVDFIHLMPCPRKDGDWIVRIRMLKDRLDFVERHAAHVLRPLTFDYLNGTDENSENGDQNKTHKKAHLHSAI